MDKDTRPKDGEVPARSPHFTGREILTPHDPHAGPLTAVRNVLLQSSLSELKECGYYDRYCAQIAPDTLAQLLSSLAPGWIPVALAMAHYEACDNMMLGRDDFALLGKRVGERVQSTALVTPAKHTREADFELWSVEGALSRMWPRLFQGGSVQTIRVGPQEKLMEERGFVLNKYQYYREGHIAAVVATHASLGVVNPRAKVVSYSVPRDELVVRFSWGE